MLNDKGQKMGLISINKIKFSAAEFISTCIVLLGLAGSPDLGFGFPWNGGIPRPHQVTWSQPINMRLARKREPTRGKLKSLQTLKFEKSLRRFGPIRLLCKHVTNPLKPATNCLCTPYKLGNSLGSGLSDPAPLRWTHSGALTQVSNKLTSFWELHCLGSLLSSRWGIRTSGITFGGSSRIPWPGEENTSRTEGKDRYGTGAQAGPEVQCKPEALLRSRKVSGAGESFL